MPRKAFRSAPSAMGTVACGPVMLALLLATPPAAELAGSHGASFAPPSARADPSGSPSDTTVVRGRLFLSQTADVLEDGVVVLEGDQVVCSGPAECL